MSFFPLGGCHPCKGAEAGARARGAQEHAQSGSCRNANPLSCAFARLFASALRAPGVRVRRAQPAAEHAHDLCFSASEFGSFPPRGLTRTRTSRGWMSRHGTRLVNGLKATPRRGAPLPRATIYGDVASVGSVGTARSRTDARPSALALGGCLSPHSGESVCANPIQYVRICYINIVLGGIGSALRHNVNDGNRGAL